MLKQSRLLLTAAIAAVFSLPSFADTVVSRISPVSGHVYYVTANPDGSGGFVGQTFAQAQANAVSLGGTLVVVDNAEENQWIFSLFASQGWDMWLGLSDQLVEGTWVWSDGGVLGTPGYTYKNWSSWEPNGGTFENAAAISSWSGEWYDLYAADTRYGLTEKSGAFTAYRWNQPAGGTFNTTTAWTPTGVPGAGDGAYFDLDNAYAVTLDANTTNLLTVVDQGAVTLDLSGLTYQQTELYVGRGTKSASLNLIDGTINSGFVTLGQDAGSTGNVVFSGGLWTVSKDLVVAQRGNASLTVHGSGDLSSNNLHLARLPGAVGQLLINGAGSKIAAAHELHLGYLGEGSAVVSAGAQLSAGALFIGTQDFSFGNLTLGASTLVAGSLYVGSSGSGTLIAADNSTINTNNAFIGMYFNSTGSMTLDSGTKWTNTGELEVGHDGLADLTVQGGADIQTRWLGVARYSSSLATFTLAGAGTTLTVDEFIELGGNNGNAQMQVLDGASMAASTLIIGNGEGGGGYLLVNAASVTNSNYVTVGENGFGSLDIKNGASWSFGVNGLFIGAGPTSSGIVKISGVSTNLSNPGTINVGFGGEGTLELSNEVSWDIDFLNVANFESSDGRVLLHQSSLTTRHAIVGGDGEGFLAVTNHSSLSVNDSWLMVGNGASGVGEVMISGQDSTLTVDPGGITLGEDGKAELQVIDGASAFARDKIFIGNHPDSQGELLISNGAVDTPGEVRVGMRGIGTLNVLNGGTLSSGFGAVANDDPDAIGEVLISGAGSVWNCGDFEAAQSGPAKITLQDGGALNTVSTRIGADNSTAAVVIDNASWNLDYLGVGGDATLVTFTLSNGGEIVASSRMEMGPVGITLFDGKLAAPDFYFYDNLTAISGYGSILGRIHDGIQSVTAAGGTLSIGIAADSQGVNANSVWNVQSGATLEILDANAADMSGQFILENGVLIARKGIQAYGAPVTGYGVVVGPFSSNLASPTGVVNLTQNLDVGAQVAKVYSSDQATLGPLTTISGGTLISQKGLQLNPNSILSGFGRIQGNLKLENAVLLADEGKSLALSGVLYGYGVVVGDVPGGDLSLLTGTVNLENGVDIGARNATVYSQGPANLGEHSTLAEGTLNAPNGLVVNGVLEGFGQINADVNLQGGMLRAEPGQDLNVTGTISGYGLILNNVVGAMAPATGTMDLDHDSDLGDDMVYIYCSDRPKINATLTLNGTFLWQWDQGLEITESGVIRGHGYIAGDILNNGELRSDGEPLHISGSLTGSGKTEGSEIILGDGALMVMDNDVHASLTTHETSNLFVINDQILGRPDGWMNIGGNLDINTHHAVFLTSDSNPVALNGTTSIVGGSLTTQSSLENSGTILLSGSNSLMNVRDFWNVGSVAGHGVIQADFIGNSGVMTFSGVSDLVAPVSNEDGALITVTGVGPTTFYKSVDNNGEIHISTASFAVFLDEVTGEGAVTGEGTAIYESGTSALAAIINPGNSLIQLPATLKSGLIRQNSLAVKGTVQLTSAGAVNSLNLLTIDPTGKFDLGANDLAILDGASVGYETLRNWITADLLTSSAMADHPTTLAILDNQLFHLNSWGDVSLSTGDYDQFIVKYTYLGDVNFDGVVSQDDLLTVLANMGAAGQYCLGDVNYDGWVNLADYTLVQSNLGAGDGTLQGGTPLGIVAVPEPSTLTLLSLSSLVLLRRKRKD